MEQKLKVIRIIYIVIGTVCGSGLFIAALDVLINISRGVSKGVTNIPCTWINFWILITLSLLCTLAVELVVKNK